MSRQSKQARNNKIAKQFSELRKSGSKGPSKTKAAHGKQPENRYAHNNFSRVGRKVKMEEAS